MGVPPEMRHHGIKGMHWGHRKAPDTSASTNAAPTKATPTKAAKPTKQQIYDARGRQMLREHKLAGLEADVYLAKTAKGQAAAAAILQKHAHEYINGKDAQIAARKTTGEKWAAGISWAVLGATAAGYVALNVSAKKH